MIAGAAAFISLLAKAFFGFLINVLAFVVGVIIDINTRITASQVVTIGFPITLSVANAGLVIAIVIIAIATILRSESYGIKRALFRLVFMAILINFGLIICGAILHFSDSLTLYWLNSTSGTATTDAKAAAMNFGSAFAGSFEPQAATTLSGTDPSTAAIITGFVKDLFTGAASPATNAVGVGFIKPVIVMLVQILSLLGITISLAIFVAMLVIRYVYLVILLVLLPLAWVAWIFPATSSFFTRWWNKFVQQTFFAPFAIFFIYLAIRAESEFKFDAIKTLYGEASPSGVLAGVVGFLGNEFTQYVYLLMQAIVMVGISIGGLIAANSLGIAVAGSGIGAFKGAMKGFGGYVGRRAGGRISREATGTQRPPKTAVGRALRYINPMVGAGKVTKLVAKSELAQRRGWTQAMKEYGKKTDFGRPKELWKKSKLSDKYAAGAKRVSQKMKDSQAKVDQFNDTLKTSTNPTILAHARAGLAHEQNVLLKLQKAEQNMLTRASRNIGVSAKDLDDLSNKATEASAKFQEQTWDAQSSNRGLVGSPWFGAFKGAGIYKGKSKLKLSKEQIEELAKSSGVSLTTP